MRVTQTDADIKELTTASQHQDPGRGHMHGTGEMNKCMANSTLIYTMEYNCLSQKVNRGDDAIYFPLALGDHVNVFRPCSSNPSLTFETN